VNDGSLSFNESAIDGWTFVHVAFGLAFGLFRVPRLVAYGLILGTELVELALRRTLPFFRESTANIAADLIVGLAAYEIGRAITSV